MTRATFLLGLLAACDDPEDPCRIDARPASIDDALDTIGGLPAPVTLECFLISLERPLGLELTSDPFSAQPARGVESPRVFVRNETLTMSVVPAGEARDLLEFGEHTDGGLTVKAELAFPVELPLDPSAPFERVLAFDGARATGCSVCHLEEVAVGGGRYASTPLRPPDETIVPLGVLHDEHATCDPEVDAERCATLSALLDHGEVARSPFPEHYLTPFGG